MEKVAFGPGRVETLRAELEALGVHRVLVVTGHALAEKTPLVGRLEALLGELCAGVFSDIRQHVPRRAVLAQRRRCGGLTPTRSSASAGQSDRRREACDLVSRGRGRIRGGARGVPHRLSLRRRRGPRAGAGDALGDDPAHRDLDHALGRGVQRLGGVHRHRARDQGDLRRTAAGRRGWSCSTPSSPSRPRRGPGGRPACGRWTTRSRRSTRTNISPSPTLPVSTPRRRW